jgi:hypothetical protein
VCVEERERERERDRDEERRMNVNGIIERYPERIIVFN